MRYPDPYLRSFVWLMDIEKFYSNHPRDRGGETAWGISRNHWPEYWRDGTPTRDIALHFYHKEFWGPLRCDDLLNELVARELFEGAVVAGHFPAIKWLQMGVNGIRFKDSPLLVVDGIIGPRTLGAANWYGQRYPEALFNTVNVLQGMHFMTLEDPDFVRGWMAKRIQAVQGG